ncbi:hypothetical protein T02_5654 [Trichinella nativa]|uniref:Uncharacterized protein n=1 Tax=Trichinella nativa TaxID=6335 RepID=A0A0V1LVE3_9BILA|nr:hypothetical protein T02_5654 [Trichinella nativa]
MKISFDVDNLGKTRCFHLDKQARTARYTGTVTLKIAKYSDANIPQLVLLVSAEQLELWTIYH